MEATESRLKGQRPSNWIRTSSGRRFSRVRFLVCVLTLRRRYFKHTQSKGNGVRPSLCVCYPAQPPSALCGSCARHGQAVSLFSFASISVSLFCFVKKPQRAPYPFFLCGQLTLQYFSPYTTPIISCHPCRGILTSDLAFWVSVISLCANLTYSSLRAFVCLLRAFAGS